MFDSFLTSITKEPFWTALGLAGQATFGGRFILQWLVSEYKKRSHVPTIFWYFSLVGSLILLIYSIHRQEPVFILGFSLNTLIYLRNLRLIAIHKKAGDVTTVKKDDD